MPRSDFPSSCPGVRAMIKLGPVTVSLGLREVYKDGRAIRLGSRAFDILELMIAAQGQMISKDELLRRIWPETVVEENNLQVQISVLRKALGAGREIIKTVPGRGYRLVMDGDTPAVPPAPGIVREDPALIGREPLLAQIVETLKSCRVLTLIGTGGVGKTALARAVEARLHGQQALNVRFVSLEKLRCPDLLVEALAGALEIDCLAQATAEQSIVAGFKDQRWLLILDNCEHLIDAVARFSEQILQACPLVTLLTTSRESLRISGEVTVSVPGLDLPFECVGPQQLLHSGAVSLFLERAGALASGYRQDTASLQQIASLCRQLDGLPLAIEMAASRVGFLGLAQTLTHVQARPHGLSGSSRTAAPRHQTLLISLDLSYQLLTPAERRLLSQWARLKPGFTFAQACCSAATAGFCAESVIEGISGLISKSWLTLCHTYQCYGLSNIARGYLLDKSVPDVEALEVHQTTATPLVYLDDHHTLCSLSGAIMDKPIDTAQCLVYIVDDEQSVRVAVDRLLRSAGFPAKAFATAEAFLDEPVADQPACLLLDVNLGAASGFDLQAELSRRGSQIPIIFMTGFGTISLSVKAIKAGAHEFLTKPFNDEQLLDSIRGALIRDRQALAGRKKVAQVKARYDTLTPREREVLPLLIEGKRNSEVALELGTREITSKVHRKHIMTKMEAGSLLELVKLCALLGMQAGMQSGIASEAERPDDP